MVDVKVKEDQRIEKLDCGGQSLSPRIKPAAKNNPYFRMCLWSKLYDIAFLLEEITLIKYVKKVEHGDLIQCRECGVSAHQNCFTSVDSDDQDSFICYHCIKDKYPGFSWKKHLESKYGTSDIVAILESTTTDKQMLYAGVEDSVVGWDLYYEWLEKFEASYLPTDNPFGHIEEEILGDGAHIELDQENQDSQSHSQPRQTRKRPVKTSVILEMGNASNCASQPRKSKRKTRRR